MSYRKDNDYFCEWTLNEVNYGSLQKDSRLTTINDELKKNILTSLNINKFSGFIDYNELKINWTFRIHSYMVPKYFSSGGGLETISDSEFRIDIDINKALGISEEEFKSRLITFVKDNHIDEITLHEIKHILDSTDGIFSKGDKNYFIPKDDSNKSLMKYMSQDREIDAFLISVISNLKNIKDQEPSISFEKAIGISTSYFNTIKHLSPKKQNKFKQKVIYFWNSYK